MAAPSNTLRIVEFAAQISSGVAKLQSQLSAQGLPSPSFDEDFPETYPQEINELRDCLLDASAELHELLLDPLMLLFKFAAISNLVSIDAVARYEIPNMIPPGGSMTFEEIGKKTGLEKNALRHLLRNAMAMRILQEPQPGVVAHTSISKFLANPSINGWTQFEARDTWPATTRIIDAIQKWPNSQQPNEMGWVLANNGKTVQEVIARDPERAMRFVKGIGAIGYVTGYNMSLLPTVYEWRPLEDAKIVHVGGAMGQAAIELIKNFKDLTVVVQDSGPMLGDGKLFPAELKDRVTFQEHELFAPQTEKAPVCFFHLAFRLAFGGLGDLFAVQVLKAQIPALEPGAKILIQDVVMPEHDTVPLWRERTQRNMQVGRHALKCVSNGRKRYSDEWKALLAAADQRFILREVHVPTDNLLGIIEVSWEA